MESESSPTAQGGVSARSGEELGLRLIQMVRSDHAGVSSGRSDSRPALASCRARPTTGVVGGAFGRLSACLKSAISVVGGVGRAPFRQGEEVLYRGYEHDSV